jgi:DNA-binding IclR family transcriptional regulator
MGRVLASLRLAGLVEMAADSQLYHLGPATAWLGDAYLKQSDLVQRAYPVMQRLFAKVGETVSLHALRGGARVPITQIESTSNLRWAAQLGRTYPLHAGAASKVLLAYASEAQIDSVLSKPMEAYTPDTVTNPTRLGRELDRIRAKGYAVGLGERDKGAVGVAAPIFGSSQEVIACLGVAGPERRLSKTLIQDKVIPEVVVAAQEISSRLGFTNGPALKGRTKRS